MIRVVFKCDWCGRENGSATATVGEPTPPAPPPGWQGRDLPGLVGALNIAAETLSASLLCPKCVESLRTDLEAAVRRARLLSTQGAAAKDLATPATLALVRADIESAELAFDHAGLRDEKECLHKARICVSEAKRILEERR